MIIYEAEKHVWNQDFIKSSYILIVDVKSSTKLLS